MSTMTICHTRRELARRGSGGIEVALYWCPTDDSTSIEVWHPASEARLAFLVPRERALDAFYHPFAHISLESGGTFAAHQAGAHS